MLIPLATAMAVTKKRAVRHEPVRDPEEVQHEPTKRRASKNKQRRPPRTAIKIACSPKKDGDDPSYEEVMGYLVTPNLAVTPAHSGSGWCITHVPTGLKISSHQKYATASRAIEIIHKVLALGIPWDKMTDKREKNMKLLGNKRDRLSTLLSEVD